KHDERAAFHTDASRPSDRKNSIRLRRQETALHILLTSILKIERPPIVQATVCAEPIWAANVESNWSTAALHRIPPGADAAHPLVIAVDHLQRCVVRLGSRHRRVIRRRWSVT